MPTHEIPLNEAIDMTTRYRDNKESILQSQYMGKDILPVCESFDPSIFATLTNVTGYAGIRIYYGMDESLKVHAILVAYDASGNDILPNDSGNVSATTGGGVLGEDGTRCPPFCPPPSPLNGF